MAKKPQRVEVEIPKPSSDEFRVKRVGLFAVVGLVIGIAWPTLAGIHIGPEVPGSKKAAPKAAPSQSSTSTASAPIALAASARQALPTPSKEQSVVIEGGTIKHCFKGKKRIAAELCGPLRVDRVLTPRLKELKGCPSALGLSGELELGFDLDFAGKEIHVRRAAKSKLPSSTVRGILACAADYIRDVSADNIPHKFSKYHVKYTIKFYPPGTRPEATAPDAQQQPTELADRSLAAVTWDTALVRDEPRTGKIVARLVRGTRVTIMGRRKDWYRVKIQSKQGWVYRGALGL